MNPPPSDHGNGARLVAMTVVDGTAAWKSAGFTVAEDQVRLGATAIQLLNPRSNSSLGSVDSRRGIRGWAVAGLDMAPGEQLLDGLPTSSVEKDEPEGTDHSSTTAYTGAEPAHSNGVTGVDHVVISTPDLERTIAAFEEVGLGCRRIREAGTNDAPFRQAFFRVGSVIVEVVGAVDGTGQPAAEAPSTWFGLALDVADIDATAALLGPALGRIKAAVQPGRRIATLRRREVGLGTSIAFMDHHGDR